MNQLEALEKAVDVLGGQTAVAKICGDPVRQQHVRNWLYRDGKTPEKHAVKIQRATDAKGDPVFVWELCPEAFPRDVFEKSNIENQAA